MAGKAKGAGVTIVIRKEEGSEARHHGGAWKVAYADFVTAMMAFFLLMWLLNATSAEQRRGLADHFSPSNVMARAMSGSGQPFGGLTPHSDGFAVSDNGAIRIEHGPAPARLDIEDDDGEAPHEGTTEATGTSETTGTNETKPPESPAPPAAETSPATPGTAAAAEAGQPAEVNAELIPDDTLRTELARRERIAFERAAEDIRAAVRDDQGLAEFATQLMVEHVPEGLRIQLLDADRQPMFPIGGVLPNERARALLHKVMGIAARLPNALAIAGHTDASPFRGLDRSNWELSADRANAVRRIMVEGGITEARLHSVTGHAARDLLLPDQPTAAANRRVAITVLRQLPESAAP
jgi:chemotaxis protein MotB